MTAADLLALVVLCGLLLRFALRDRATPARMPRVIAAREIVEAMRKR